MICNWNTQKTLTWYIEYQNSRYNSLPFTEFWILLLFKTLSLINIRNVIRGGLWRHNGCDGGSITSLIIVYSAVNSGADQRKHQSSASLAFVRRIHWWPVNSPTIWPVTGKMFPYDDVIIGRIPRWQQARHIMRLPYMIAIPFSCFMETPQTNRTRYFHNASEGGILKNLFATNHSLAITNCNKAGAVCILSELCCTPRASRRIQLCRKSQ